ncbi:MAG: ATP-binding protein [Candidatus Rokubacteria bacterium]|nr:ATP-binding protein [Candidatus Rokubacteria bacterium]MBI3826935.1 ATP-binding protein [Candidatus Rokubacteria bacterium]
MVERSRWLSALRAALKRSRVTALVGPRQAGKTTLARQIVPENSPAYFDLEDPRGLARLAEPMMALGPLRGIVVIDEIQRRPDLFPVLRVLADRRPIPARFLILGSATPDLLKPCSETLAGRLETIELTGFALDELGAPAMRRLWRRGGFPPAYLARSEHASYVWRRQFMQTYLERDLPQLGITVPSATMLRFWTMLAHYHGGVWNAAEAARSLGVSEPTARRYLDLLSGLFMVRQLQPWHENLKKRQVKAPKVYLRDSGLLHALLGLAGERELLSHPKAGASWEGYAIEQAVALVRPEAAYFWATHTGAELDLLLIKRGQRYGVEVKFQDAPRLTPSMRTAISDLRLRHLTVLYPGDRQYELGRRVTVVPLTELARDPEVIARVGRAPRVRAGAGPRERVDSHSIRRHPARRRGMKHPEAHR